MQKGKTISESINNQYILRSRDKQIHTYIYCSSLIHFPLYILQKKSISYIRLSPILYIRNVCEAHTMFPVRDADLRFGGPTHTHTYSCTAQYAYISTNELEKTIGNGINTETEQEQWLQKYMCLYILRCGFDVIYTSVCELYKTK